MSTNEPSVGPNVWLLPSKDGGDPMSAYLTRDDADAERDDGYELEPVEYVPAARLLSEARDASVASDRAAMAARAHAYRGILVAIVEALHNGSFAGEHTSDAMLRAVPKEVDGYCAMLRRERSMLERKLAVLTEALLFYADDRNWLVTVADGRRAVLAKRSDFTYGAAYEEGGVIARAALTSAASLSERTSVRPPPPETAEKEPAR